MQTSPTATQNLVLKSWALRRSSQQRACCWQQVEHLKVSLLTPQTPHSQLRPTWRHNRKWPGLWPETAAGNKKADTQWKQSGINNTKVFWCPKAQSEVNNTKVFRCPQSPVWSQQYKSVPVPQSPVWSQQYKSVPVPKSPVWSQQYKSVLVPQSPQSHRELRVCRTSWREDPDTAPWKGGTCRWRETDGLAQRQHPLTHTHTQTVITRKAEIRMAEQQMLMTHINNTKMFFKPLHLSLFICALSCDSEINSSIIQWRPNWIGKAARVICASVLQLFLKQHGIQFTCQGHPNWYKALNQSPHFIQVH